SKKEEIEIGDHKIALELIASYLLNDDIGILNSVDDLDVVGHRVVHGGIKFTKTVIIDEAVKKNIRRLFSLAPLHNPPNLTGIEIAEDIFSKAKQIAVFDTAFHQTIPQKAYQYAIPSKFLNENNIRLYGFHGTSHKFVSQIAVKHLNKKDSKIISIHLGNGCSMSAVRDGICIDTSLGFAPGNGLIMGTRSGDIDHAVVFYLIDHLGYSPAEVNNMLTKESGMLGLTGKSDLRDIESAAASGDKACKLALEMNAYRIKKYIGSYAAIMNGIDAIVFTAGIGENSQLLRSLVCEKMGYLGIKLDADKNAQRSSDKRAIHADDSSVEILVIPTNEELEIARQACELVNSL
ncbi:MAG: acetate kinase, partial [Leeuwenhoekiella sp.]